MNPYLFSILHSFFGTSFLYKNSVAPLDVYTLWGTHQGTHQREPVDLFHGLIERYSHDIMRYLPAGPTDTCVPSLNLKPKVLSL